MNDKEKISPKVVWEEYLEGENYHQSIDLHEKIKNNLKIIILLSSYKFNCF